MGGSLKRPPTIVVSLSGNASTGRCRRSTFTLGGVEDEPKCVWDHRCVLSSCSTDFAGRWPTGFGVDELAARISGSVRDTSYTVGEYVFPSMARGSCVFSLVLHEPLPSAI
jgi:hypothetical protein